MLSWKGRLAVVSVLLALYSLRLPAAPAPENADGLEALRSELSAALAEAARQRSLADAVSIRLAAALRRRSPPAPTPRPPPPSPSAPITVTAAALYCNCPSIVGGRGAARALELLSAHAFARRVPVRPGDAAGCLNVTAAAAAQCDGREQCVFTVPPPAPGADCGGKVDVDYRCGGEVVTASAAAQPGTELRFGCADGAPVKRTAVDGILPVVYTSPKSKRVVEVWPISFSIPSHLWSGTVSWKDRDFASVIPGNNRTYVHREQVGTSGRGEPDELYWHEYRHSYYCVTRKKKGWDALRHYEILAAGCVPYFVDLGRAPDATLPNFPRALVAAAMALPGVQYNTSVKGSFWHAAAFTINHTVFPKDRYHELAARIQQHARQHLTSAAVARYVLRVLAGDGPIARRVLFIQHCYWDFLGDSVWSGFRELASAGELEVLADVIAPREMSQGGDSGKSATLWKHGGCTNGRKPALTASAETLDRKTYYRFGRSWGLHRVDNLVPTSESETSPDGIPNRIAAKEFDVVIYPTPQRTVAWLDLVTAHYPPSAVAFLLGGDSPEELGVYEGYSRKGRVFSRELYDEAGADRGGKVCMESQGIAEAQGLDCCGMSEVGAQIVMTTGGDAGMWRKCAGENGNCSCATSVRFGNPQTGKWAYRELNGNWERTRCININSGGLFPDPAVGAPKLCQCRIE
eukprot:TRINITY_DN4898_c0_g4_i2.p1 TRINITY_DN4898_c0_g4~~TRINITY_DN4898_c0_g4_i2.p1  ORF type:complete len:690 (+),score=214.30 TRINITY_DN4898_c0_g4_i2:322-2391(+)